MGVVDVFSREDRVDVMYSDFYAIVKEATKTEIMKDAFQRGESPENILNVMFDKNKEVMRND